MFEVIFCNRMNTLYEVTLNIGLGEIMIAPVGASRQFKNLSLTKRTECAERACRTNELGCSRNKT